MAFNIVTQDITKMKVDAIVNAANTQLQMGGGVCGAIFKAADANKLQEACDYLGPIKTGEAVITPGFNLKAKFVIHTAGPIYDSSNPSLCRQLLVASYLNSLKLAVKNKCKSIAFPLISSGIYGYPKEEALAVAKETICEFLKNIDVDVYLIIFDKASFIISEDLIRQVNAYIDENYVEKHFLNRIEGRLSKEYFGSEKYCSMSFPSLGQIIDDLDEPFNDSLLRLIDNKGKRDVEVYKKANLDRKLFSKIKNGKNYTPKKKTVLALAIALELDLEETEDLLEKAGYALSHSQIFDVIVEYFIINRKYDIFEINEVLFKYNQQLLGAN